MVVSKLRWAEKKKTDIKKTITQLKKDYGKAVDKSKRKKIRREIMKLQDSIPGLNRIIHQNSKDPVRDQKEENRREEVQKHQQEAELAKLIKQDLEKRKTRTIVSTQLKDKSEKSNKVCPSCGVPYNYSSGFSRCRCT
jgi:hypothetical protein